MIYSNNRQNNVCHELSNLADFSLNFFLKKIKRVRFLLHRVKHSNVYGCYVTLRGCHSRRKAMAAKLSG